MCPCALQEVELMAFKGLFPLYNSMNAGGKVHSQKGEYGSGNVKTPDLQQLSIPNT